MTEPFLRTTWTDPVTGRHGYLVIDRLVNGIAGGGTRRRAGLTLEEVERLARAMSHKNGAVGVRGGGAKGGIDIDPQDPEARGMLVRFYTAMRPLLETYWATAEDMGVSQELLNEIFQEIGLGYSTYAGLKNTGDIEAAKARMAAGFAVQEEGEPIAGLAGSYGVKEATRAALDFLGLPITGARIAVQGFGSIGAASARYLARDGAKVVCIADALGAVVDPGGLDIETLYHARNAFGELDRSKLPTTARQLPRDEWIAADADVLVPAAVADAITEANCDRITARLVVEGANIPATLEAERRLHARGVTVVPDFVANCGTNAWFWWTIQGVLAPNADAAYRQIGDKMRTVVPQVLERAKAEGTTPREAAEAIATETLDRLAAS